MIVYRDMFIIIEHMLHQQLYYRHEGLIVKIYVD